VEVADTGIGIPPEKVEAIFQSFQQGEKGLSRGYPGLGLGLALTRKLAHVMDGSITLESEVDKGSTFTFRLPLVASALLSEHSSDAGDRTEGPAILAVDDNTVGLTVLRHALERRYQNLDFATSGLQALQAAAARQYDLILMDVQMPEMDGLEAAVRIRQIPGYENTPILALTANSSDTVRDLCREGGMQAFLSKPVEATQLLATLGRFLK
jgi:CheY-like chemotaxis protein